MASEKITAIIEELKTLTVLELSELVHAVEDAYKDAGYDKITLTTFGFQAPEFYKKLGYEVEFIREDNNPQLRKYFLIKII